MWIILKYSILFYSVFPLSSLIFFDSWTSAYIRRFVARAPFRPEEILWEWHADRCGAPFLPSSLLPLLPSSPPWNSSRAGMIDTVQFTPNQNAPCVICLKWPHALLVRATANYLACHYRRLLIRKKYSQEISLLYKKTKQIMGMFSINKHPILWRI